MRRGTGAESSQDGFIQRFLCGASLAPLPCSAVSIEEFTMGFFIADALAQDAGAPAGGGFGALLFPILLLVVFYFLLIRPQQKRAKEHRKMVEALAKGDEVVSTGGIAGRITDVGETFATMEIADGVQVRLQKGAVASVLPKGTLRQKLEKGAGDKAKGEDKQQDEDAKS